MIEEQLKNYLQVELRFLTTPCVIIETEKLGSKFMSVTNKLKSVQLNKCGHERNPISGAECIKALTKENRYIIATQDRDLQEWIRFQTGIALLYLHNVVPTLEEPSEASRRFVDRKLKKSIQVSSFESEQLKLLKKKEGLVKEPKVYKLKKKKKSGPNPLSCKKKKSTLNAVKEKTIDKKKKARRKV
jgi:U3 small nucleolar RNA-associated protein 23